jgi:hypothetical protein
MLYFCRSDTSDELEYVDDPEYIQRQQNQQYVTFVIVHILA